MSDRYDLPPNHPDQTAQTEHPVDRHITNVRIILEHPEVLEPLQDGAEITDQMLRTGVYLDTPSPYDVSRNVISGSAT